MSIRRNTTNRLSLIRQCGTCGKSIGTSADSPWIRQMPKGDKKQATVYFCSSVCYQKSYKHIGWYDGKSDERRAAKEAARDVSGKNKRYYQRNKNRIKKQHKVRYWDKHDEFIAQGAFYRKKRKLIGGGKGEVSV